MEGFNDAWVADALPNLSTTGCTTGVGSPWKTRADYTIGDGALAEQQRKLGPPDVAQQEECEFLFSGFESDDTQEQHDEQEGRESRHRENGALDGTGSGTEVLLSMLSSHGVDKAKEAEEDSGGDDDDDGLFSVVRADGTQKRPPPGLAVNLFRDGDL